MSLQLINHSTDLHRLSKEGYELEIKGGYLFIHHIPYLNSAGEIKFGTLASELTLASPTQTAQPVHSIYFIGEKPCHRDGNAMNEIIYSSPDQALVGSIIGNHLFSSKPPCGFYADYYEKVIQYYRLLSAPAQALNKEVTAQTYKPILWEDETSVFRYPDTNAGRVHITKLNEKFQGQRIAIIGLGGTGSYLLDMVAKTPVQEIHPYDGDDLLQHNAFRAPGAVPLAVLEQNPKVKKVAYYAAIYSNIHKNIIPHAEYVNEDNIEALNGMSYVFVCIDKGSQRKIIIQALIRMNLPFVDVGLGVQAADGKLTGMVRVTAGKPEKYGHLPNRVPFEDDDNEEYASNIQIAELNALNATLAVLKWKKMSGYYHDFKNEYHSTYTINTSQLLHEDTAS